jgi:uncharacterized protein (DUF2384 family)
MKKKPHTMNPEPQVVQEPWLAYGAFGLSLLANYTPRDLDNAKLPGQAIVHVQEQTHLAPQELATALGISKTKYYDLLQQPELDARTIDTLADFSIHWQKGLDAFEGDQTMLLEWLNTRNENLGGIHPITLLSSRLGRRELEKAFLRIEHSTFG